jgi:cytoskeletal protein RodZ
VTDQHQLGRLLRDTRESRGIDLDRAERDTKIRARYLHALERGDYRDLPGGVYASGFLRNYAAYLGLDPDAIVEQYRRETQAAPQAAGRAAPPRPRVAPRVRGPVVVVTPDRVLAVLLVLLVVGIAVYLGVQFATFAGTPELRLTDPLTDVAAFRGTRYTIRGVTEPRARVTVEGPERQYEDTAAADGRFAVAVEVNPGANQVTIVAYDPMTGRFSAEQRRTVTVVSASPGASPSPAAAP